MMFCALGLALLAAWVFGPASSAAAAALALAALAAVLATALARERPGAGLMRQLARRLGDTSYAIYLTHGFVLGAAARMVAEMGAGDADADLRAGFAPARGACRPRRAPLGGDAVVAELGGAHDDRVAHPPVAAYASRRGISAQ